MPSGIAFVRLAINLSGWKNEITEIVHGGARGVDSAANSYCSGKWPITVFRPDWQTHGKGGGAIRNKAMADYADSLIAIFDGVETPGTMNMVRTARKQGLKVFVFGLASENSQGSPTDEQPKDLTAS